MTPHPITTFVGAKGGVGTSVTAALAALNLRHTETVLLIDAAGGDQFTIFGVPTPDNGIANVAGVSIIAAPTVTHLRAALAELDPVTPGLSVIVDAGTDAAMAEAARDAVSEVVLVTNGCFLALRRAMSIDCDRIVVVDEPGRAISPEDIAETLGKPVTRIERDPAIARMVDAGILIHRIPKSARQVA